ncbi:bleomycin resistance protein [Paenibacillus lentus]|uniref:bleomycin resistance protein n=1 Tax=Paenibacillus lentus TaxID=1338368 RepID=UPI00364D8AB2
MAEQMFGKVIPILPCRSMNEQLDFYQSLGFEMTYKQARPNQYACVRHPIAELHFFVLKELDPAKNYSMCYVNVDDVDTVYETFCESLKRNTNRIPTRGYPKITKPNNLAEDRRFNLVDPSGNRLLIGAKHAVPQSNAEQQPYVTVHASKFKNAFETAYRLAYAKDDPAHAAKVLDLVLPGMEEAPLPLRYRAVILRADIAHLLDENEAALSFIEKINQISLSHISLSAEEHHLVQEAAKRLEELKAVLMAGQ